MDISKTIEKIKKLKTDVKDIKEAKERTIKKLDLEEWEISLKIKNLLKRLSLQKCRFKIGTDVMFKNVPAKIYNRHINDSTYEIYYDIRVEDKIIKDIYENDSDLDDINNSDTHRRNSIISDLNFFIGRFNFETFKWRSKDVWKEYTEWSKDNKDILIVVSRTPTSGSYCFKPSEFFSWKCLTNEVKIEEILLNGKDCKRCRLRDSCIIMKIRFR